MSSIEKYLRITSPSQNGSSCSISSLLGLPVPPTHAVRLLRVLLFHLTHMQLILHLCWYPFSLFQISPMFLLQILNVLTLVGTRGDRAHLVHCQALSPTSAHLYPFFYCAVRVLFPKLSKSHQLTCLLQTFDWFPLFSDVSLNSSAIGGPSESGLYLPIQPHLGFLSHPLHVQQAAWTSDSFSQSIIISFTSTFWNMLQVHDLLSQTTSQLLFFFQHLAKRELCLKMYPYIHSNKLTV